MIRLLIGKTFFDGWDDLLCMVLLNLPFVALAAAEALLFLVIFPDKSVGGLLPLDVAILLASAVPFALHAGASAWALTRVAEGGRPRFSDWLEGLGRTWAKAALFGPLFLAACGLCAFGASFYLRGAAGPLGLALAGLLLWLLLFLLLAQQWFFPCLARQGGSFPSLLRRCALLTADNLGFSAALALANLLVLPLSLVLGGLAPGASWALLLCDEGLALRLRKYDWLEAHPGADRRKLPWAELLAEERKALESRTLKGFFFPWKDAK